MKKLFTILTVLALAIPAWSQFIIKDGTGVALVCPSGGFVLDDVDGGTNVTTASLAPAFKLVSNKPVGLYLDWGSTNANSGKSNIMVRVQVSVDGTKWMGPAANGSVQPDLNAMVPPSVNLGPQGGAQQCWPLLWCSAGGAGLSGIQLTNLPVFNYIRLHTLSNYTGGGQPSKFYITNAFWVQQE